MARDRPDGPRAAACIALVIAGGQSTMFEKINCALDIDAGFMPAEEIMNVGFIEFASHPKSTENPVRDAVAATAA